MVRRKIEMMFPCLKLLFGKYFGAKCLPGLTVIIVQKFENYKFHVKNDISKLKTKRQNMTKDIIINCKRTVNSKLQLLQFCLKTQVMSQKATLLSCGFLYFVCFIYVKMRKGTLEKHWVVFTLPYKLISFQFKCLATNGTFCL